MATDPAQDALPEDKNMGTVLLALTSVLIFFTVTTTVLRLWTRGKRRILGWVRSNPNCAWHKQSDS
jgi:hypothetical protein